MQIQDEIIKEYFSKLRSNKDISEEMIKELEDLWDDENCYVQDKIIKILKKFADNVD